MRHTAYMAVLVAAGCSGPPTAVDDDGHQLAVITAPLPPQEDALGTAYTAYHSDTASTERQRAYFAAFPSDYASLRKEFGFEELDEDSTLYGEYYEQGSEMIGAFFRLAGIPPAEIARKAVGIARNGEWQEDGVGYFQLFLARRLEKEPTVYLGAINALPAKDQAGFWRFYVDGPEVYPMDDALRLRRLLVKVPAQLNLVDSVLAISRTKH